MDCPADIVTYAYDEEGAPVSEQRTPCTGTLEGPVPNDLTGNIEIIAMGNDLNGHPVTGRNWYCPVCGQTTLVPDVRNAG